jgi:hypothetical protein
MGGHVSSLSLLAPGDTFDLLHQLLIYNVNAHLDSPL